jgi:hypothetical protein
VTPSTERRTWGPLHSKISIGIGRRRYKPVEPSTILCVNAGRDSGSFEIVLPGWVFLPTCLAIFPRNSQ